MRLNLINLAKLEKRAWLRKRCLFSLQISLKRDVQTAEAYIFLRCSAPHPDPGAELPCSRAQKWPRRLGVGQGGIVCGPSQVLSVCPFLNMSSASAGLNEPTTVQVKRSPPRLTRNLLA